MANFAGVENAGLELNAPMCSSQRPHSFISILVINDGPKKKRNIENEARIKCSIQRFDSGAYMRMQFLHAMSHSLGAHTDALQFAPDASDYDNDDDDNHDIYAAPAEPAHASRSATF